MQRKTLCAGGVYTIIYKYLAKWTQRDLPGCRSQCGKVLGLTQTSKREERTVMNDYLSMSHEQLLEEQSKLAELYAGYQAKNLKLDMSRGKPCVEQLDLSEEMYQMVDNYIGENGVDARNYGLLEGMPEARRFFAELLEVAPEEVIVCGNSSLSMMYYLIDLGWRKGFVDSLTPWRFCLSNKFLCPVPGYDRHFRVTEYFGFQLISVPMNEDGPDMDMVERLVKDEGVKGMWCVPKYSNPDGYVYSDEVIHRLASMETAAKDFKLIWDDAYCVHHLTDEEVSIPSILAECKEAGHPERPLLFCSTSKITYPGAGVAAVAGSEANVHYITENMMPMVISYDKMNQLRHVQFLKNKEGVLAHMRKHRKILEPKFNLVKETFTEELNGCGKIARWTDPKGGYFISLYLREGCAKRTVQLCKEAGVVLTGAGAAYPYGIDPRDSHLRIAPTFPSLEELKTATDLLCICVRMATVEQLLREG